MLHADLIAPIPELLKRHARERGGKVAYRDAQSSVTYAQLDERTARLAAHLADRGIAPGDTVAILLPNSTQWIETCFAIARAGAIGVPVSYDASEPEIAYRLEDANCRAIVTTAERGDLVAKLKAVAPSLQTVIATNRGGPRPDALSYESLLSTPAVSAPRDPPLMHEPPTTLASMIARLGGSVSSACTLRESSPPTLVIGSCHLNDAPNCRRATPRLLAMRTLAGGRFVMQLACCVRWRMRVRLQGEKSSVPLTTGAMRKPEEGVFGQLPCESPSWSAPKL